MVAVRSSHLNPVSKFAIDAWVTSLGLTNSQSNEKLANILRYCKQCYKDHPNASLLLWRGIEMVEILSMFSTDNDSLCAALLFPLADAGIVEEMVLEAQFGKKIVKLVLGVRDMSAIRQLKVTYNDSITTKQVDNVRRMLLAIVEDFRCVVIKLAERITHLRELKNAPEEERLTAAKESNNIYAPLANRLGIGQLKWELEDFCFRYLHPEEYKYIAKLLHERRIDREHYIEDFVNFLRKAMKEAGLESNIYGRPKHIYSIWRKMQKKTLKFNELFDLRAVRIIVERLQDCYAALGIVHTHFQHLSKEFDDYIANPKPNGYQSIHTVVIGPHDKTLEIQIRTRQMHEDAEMGVAAHWKYKEGSNTFTVDRSGYEQRIAWLRKLLTWQEEIEGSCEVLNEVGSQVFNDRVYVFTPKGDVIDLPARSTPLDFAYYIHSDIGHCCIGAKINGRIVQLTYQLRMADQVEIITQKHPNPSLDWLNINLGYVTTDRGRSKINNWFHRKNRDKNISAGRQLLENELEHLGLTVRKAEKFLLPHYNVNSFDELLVSISSGDTRINQILNYLQSKLNKYSSKEEDQPLLKQLTQKTPPMLRHFNNDQVIIGGVKNLMHRIARCCQPIQGDNITGFITKRCGISVHRADCQKLADLYVNAPERIVETVWNESHSNEYLLIIRMTVNDRSGLLRDITAILANEKINVLGITNHNNVKRQLTNLDINIDMYNRQILRRVLSKLKQVPDILDAYLLHRN